MEFLYSLNRLNVATSRAKCIALFILDEAHHAAPAAGIRYAISSQLMKAIRELGERFEHRLFLTATPHNGFQ
jgi:ABC-type branched-subunit amino acid transport system ATPase component